MGRITGQGGFVTAATLDNTYVNERVDNKSYVINTTADIDDTSDSGTGQWRQGTPILSKVDSVEITIFDDDTQYFDVIGLVENAIVSFYFKRGNSPLFNSVTGAIVQSVRETNENEHVRGIVITSQYGTLKRQVPAPVIV